MSEIPLPSGLQIALSLYGYFLPLMLYAVWSTLAFWDLARRQRISRVTMLGWTAVVLLVPFLGAFAYHVVGGSEVPKPLRAMVVGGGLGLCVVMLAIGSLLGGTT